MARVFIFISSTSNLLDLASSSRQKNRRPGDGRRNKNSQIIAEFVGQGAVFFDVGPSVNWFFGSPRKPGGWVFQGGFLQKTGGFWLANEVEFCYQLDFVKETVTFTGPVGCIQHCIPSPLHGPFLEMSSL